MIDPSLYTLFFKALSNETRIRIVHLLREGPRNVSQICEALGMEQSRVSHNLRCLAHCGFVTVQQNGKNREYSLDREVVLPILEAVDGHIERCRVGLKSCEVLREERNQKVTIEFLYFREGCPSWEEAKRNLEEVLVEEGIEAEVVEREITTEEDAVRHRFLGSPTILIDGRDIEEGARGAETFQVGCRVYRTEEGLTGVPPKEMIRRALQETG
jgi:DNA-binding transcriptional ArsR family regulator